jgi:ATP-binding cassette, subfamily B, bacterial
MKRSGMKLIAWHYFNEAKRYPGYVVGLLLLPPLGIFCNVFASTYIASEIIDKLSHTGRVPVNQLWHTFGTQIILFFIAIIAGELIIWRLVLFLVWKLEVRVQFALFNQCFEFLSHQSAQFHADKFGGSLVSQTNKFVSGYVRLADTIVFNLLPFTASLIFALTILWFRVPWFAAGMAVVTLIFISITIASYSKIARLNKASSEASNKLSGQIADMISNILAVKSFSAEKREMKRFAGLNTTAARKESHLMMATMKRDIGFASSLVLLLALMFGSILIGQATIGISIGTMILMLTYSLNLFNQLWQVNGMARSYNRIFGDALPMAEILQDASVITDVDNPEKPHIHDGEITLHDVNFAYSENDEALFENFNLQIAPGERVGLVGHSGSGKTTLTNLLLRFNDIDSGSITIDGQDIATIRQADLRKQIAYVPQQPLLFHRSLKENIAYGKPGASTEEIIAAAEKANATEFIAKLPQEYETLVGERGVKLSGGQRQRIAIARALLKNAPILILDEATSALDSESEVLIQDALWTLMEGRTAIVIAHRLSTIQKMDRIIVMDDGRIVEQGSHAELLKAKGQYAKLWAHQSGGFIED